MKLIKISLWYLAPLFMLSIGMLLLASCDRVRGNSSPSTTALTVTPMTAGIGSGAIRRANGYECSGYTTSCKACMIVSCVCTSSNCSDGYYDAGGKHFTFDTQDPISTFNAAQHAIAKCCN